MVMARRNFRGFTAVTCVFQLTLGIALIICELVRLTFGPSQSYFIGAFIAGIPMMLSGIVSMVIFVKAKGLNTIDRHAVKIFSCLIGTEIVLGIVSLIGCLVSCFFVIAWGFERTCNSYWIYDDSCHAEDLKSRLNAIIAIGFIIACGVVSFLVIMCDCVCKRQFGVYFCQRPRRGDSDHVITYQPAVAPPIGVNTGYKYGPANVPPQQAGVTSYGSRIQELEEENRLLQEQIRLQREQLELQHQLHGEAGFSSRYTPPPPSYDECTTEESTIRLLEEQNKELQIRCEEQKNELQDYDTTHDSSPGQRCTPSAPPDI